MAVTDTQLRSWYLDHGYSAEEIGRRIGKSGATARRKLLALGVTMRTRREQIDFHDHAAGRRIPSADELEASYHDERLTMAELAERHGLTSSRIRLLMLQHKIPTRRSGKRTELIEAERSTRRRQRPIKQFVEMYKAGESATAIARKTGWDRKVIAAGLRDAGVQLRVLPPTSQWVDRYTVGGETAVEIAVTFGVSANAIYQAMEVAGIPRRPPVVRHRAANDVDIIDAFVDQQLSVADVAVQLDTSEYLVREALRRHDVDVRRRLPIDEDRLIELRRAGGTLNSISVALGVSRSRVRDALQRLGLPPREPVRNTTLTIPTEQLQRLVDDGVDDEEIAARHQVATWAVLRRRRAENIRRPLPVPKPDLTHSELRRRLNAGDTLSAIASDHCVGLGTVRRWCDVYGFDRPSTDTRGVEGRPDLDPALLRRLYVDERWTTSQIAAEHLIDTAIVTFALHSHRIPVRPAGPSAREPVVVLDALYDDRRVVAVLDQHRVPVRRNGGWLDERFSEPVDLDSGVAVHLYGDVGLSTIHISLLTGNTATLVRNHLRRAGVALRRSGRSPWFSRMLIE